MKKYVFGILLIIAAILQGCHDTEGYSLGDIWVGFGVVQSTDQLTIVMDNGDSIVAVAYGNYNDNYDKTSDDDRKIEKGDRVIINYTVLDDKTNAAGEIEVYFVKINSAQKILMKGILDITPAIEDSIGNDPIVIQEFWVTKNLLNLQMKYWGEYKTHFINLVKRPGNLTVDDQPFELELRHNANDDLESIPYTGFVSFVLDSLQVTGADSVRFVVKSTDYEGIVSEFECVYKYGGNN